MRPGASYRLVAPGGSDGGWRTGDRNVSRSSDERSGGRRRLGRPDRKFTVKCQLRWGQAQLFPEDRQPGGPRRYRVFDCSTWGPATASLTLATAQARAVALTGRSALIWSDDGSGVTVTRTSPGGFDVAVYGTPSWAELCRSLLDRHG
jgi:hypothetical protein